MNRTLIRIGIVVLALPLLAAGGCAVNDKDEVALYRRHLGATTRSAEFDAGAPLSLADALSLANEHNERLLIEGENYVQALADKERAAARFLPTVTFAPQYARTDIVSSAGEGGGGRLGRLDVPVIARATVNPIGDYADLRRAGLTADQRLGLLLDLQSSILLDTARTYYQVLRAERSVEVLEFSSRLQAERVRDARARRRLGITVDLAVRQAEAQEAQIRAALIAARNDVVVGRALLGELTAAPVHASRLTDDLGVPADGPTLSAALDAALATRFDLAAARSAVAAAARSVDANVARYYPSVSLNLNAWLSRQSSPTERDWDALLSANLPLLDLGVIHADVRAAMSRLRQAKSFESLTARRIESEVRQAVNGYDAAGRRLELAAQVAAAEEAYRLAVSLYNEGSGTYLDVLVAQDQRVSARLSFTTQEFDRKVAYLNLLRVTGVPGPKLAGTLPATRPATLPSTVPSSLPSPADAGRDVLPASVP